VSIERLQKRANCNNYKKGEREWKQETVKYPSPPTAIHVLYLQQATEKIFGGESDFLLRTLAQIFFMTTAAKGEQGDAENKNERDARREKEGKTCVDRGCR
jgi:hypothetical protein